MILVWSSEGGPLQCIGLAIFLIQFIIPQIYDPPPFIHNMSIDELGIGGLPLLIMILCLVLGMAAFMGWFFSDHPGIIGGNDNGGAARNSGDGTADNPVDVDAQDDDRNNNPLVNTIRRTLPNISPHYLLLASAFILPLSMVIPIFINLGASGIVESSSGTIAVTVLAIAAHACMAMAAYGVLREFLSGAHHQFPGNRRGAGGTRIKKYTMGEIADLVRKVPVEEYVSEREIRNGECSISKMKRILINRGAADAAERCLERQDLVNEIYRVRKYEEKECTICSEEYAEGDALRVLPCQHEYHLHCFDRWVYTFATDARANAEPSCPLCKCKLR
ncbi:hypothetical protein ACHAWO_001340 [Cyclotella atomus]|uniref:RING-type domain-containing protein n=1 Tax=Cyclotella atomus TaxID=382360 RepID=A0ABD3PQ97_9STRA